MWTACQVKQIKWNVWLFWKNEWKENKWMAASEGPGEDTSKWNMWSFRLFDVFLCDPACLSVNESKWGVSRKGLQVYILHVWLPGRVSCWMPHSKNVGFLTGRKLSSESCQVKVFSSRFPIGGVLEFVGKWSCASACDQVAVCNSRLALELCTCCFASEVVQVKVVKRMSSVQGFIFEG